MAVSVIRCRERQLGRESTAGGSLATLTSPDYNSTCTIVCPCLQFPLSMMLMCGSQADRAERNKITILKVTDIHKTQIKEGELEVGIGGKSRDS